MKLVREKERRTAVRPGKRNPRARLGAPSQVDASCPRASENMGYPARLPSSRSRIWLGLVLSCWLSVGAAQAQAGSADPVASPPGSSDAQAASTAGTSTSSDAPEPPGYGNAVEAGIKEHVRGNYQEARVHFLRAHALFPNARTLRGLGKVDYELRNYGDAVRYLEEALASQVRPLDQELRLETQQLLERARVYVGEVHVAVEPGSATVSVDGVTMATGPKASLSLLVGDHVLEFRAQGRMPERRSVRILGGERTVIQVVLSAPPETLSTSSHAHDDRKPLYKRWWLWTAVGVVAAGVAVGIAVAATRDPEHLATETGSTGVTLRNP
jgi:hypothetical protein